MEVLRMKRPRFPLSVITALFLVFMQTSLSAAAVPDSADSGFVIQNGVLIDYTGSGGEITVPAGVREIKEYAFQGYETKLTGVTLPEGLTTLDFGAFVNCTALKYVTLPATITEIRSGTFQGCTGLQSVSLPEGLTSIARYAFSGCTGLTSVRIPSSVTEIYWHAFENCAALQAVTLPAGLKAIGESAFAGSGLTSVSIPDSVTGIDKYAFANCKQLSQVSVAEGLYDPTVFAGTPWQDGSPQSAGAQAGSEDFPVRRSYDDRFTDLSEDDWYYQNVTLLYELGLMDGKTSNRYDPQGTLTVAEAIKLTAVINSQYRYRTTNFPKTDSWYQAYVDYIFDHVVSERLAYWGPRLGYDRPVTREVFAYLMYDALPGEDIERLLPPINDIPEGSLTGSPNIYALLRAGVCIGYPDGSFHPEESITRAEAAAIVTRLIVPEQRIKLAN
jgi:hypothetical protein